jgi:hypothetical protein
MNMCVKHPQAQYNPRFIPEAYLAASRQTDRSLSWRSAVANLLRLAHSELDDAGALLNRRKRRNAAFLAGQGLAHIIGALAASEHGWPMEDWNSGLGAVPETNPLQPELVELHALVSQDMGPAVRIDGQLAPEPDASRLGQAFAQAEALLEAISKAFDVDLAGTKPAGRVDPIRPEPVLKKPEPLVPPAARQATEAQVSSAAAKPQEPDTQKPGPARRPQNAPTARKSVQRTRLATASRKAVIVQDPPSKSVPVSDPKPPDETLVHGPERQSAFSPAENTLDPHAAAPRPNAPLRPVEQAAPASLRSDVSSTAFWSLMESWKVTDLAALDLIGHSGGLTKKGTRPRFRLIGPEAELFSYLREIGTGLKTLGKEPAEWIRQPIMEDPFKGATPVAHITQGGVVGARDVIRQIMALGLR